MKKFFYQICFVCIITFWTNFVCGAEIRLNEQSQVTDVIVRLGDIAEIVTDSPSELSQLKQIILFPSPQNSNSRSIFKTEIRDLIARLGINVFNHNFTGAEKITIINTNYNFTQFTDQNKVNLHRSGGRIIYANHITSNSNNNSNNNNNNNNNKTIKVSNTQIDTNLLLRKITPEFIKQMEKLIAESIRIYLNRRLAAVSQYQQSKWNISVKLSREQTLDLATKGQIKEIEGGIEPFVGKQKFHIKLQNIDKETNQNFAVSVDADLIPITQCVTAIRNLPKGYIISQSDVKIAECENINFDNKSIKNEGYFINTDDVIGKEIISNLRAGNIITQDQIKRPAWVRKGDTITITAKNNGVIIRAVGIAKSDGAEGDTVFVTRIEQNNTTSTRRNRRQQNTAEIAAIVTQPKAVEVNATPIISR
ncbi:MAG: flagellar basal body P-ring formation chaperone FlgA [Planctomycetaceae bacterium]|jgi:flagella basal body P-ring formation protein FlgA|nr:flagellar basal body P-ring formation chaperone FlgA [Planctomycetaceae bacterium]